MKLGILFLQANSLEKLVAQTIDYEFGATQIPFPLVVNRNAEEITSIFRENKVKIAAIGSFVNLIHPDETKREQNIEEVKEAIKIASQIGNPPVITGSGSVELAAAPLPFPAGAPSGWCPHPDNYSKETWKILVQSLKKVTTVAEENNVIVGLEPHMLTTLNTPKRLSRLLNEVASPNLKIQCDPFNLIDFNMYYRTGEFLDELFDTLHNNFVSGHAKDIIVEKKFVVHIGETYAGNGNLDYDTFLRRLNQELSEDSYLLVEHTKNQDIPKAKKYIEEKAKKLGISL